MATVGVQATDNRIVSFWSNKKYETINPRLGAGAFGRTLLVRDCDLNLLQVVKVYEPKNFTPEQYARYFQFFKSEVKILHTLNHRNIVRVYAAHFYGDNQNGLVLMEYIQGKTLADYFKDYDVIFDDCNDVFCQLVDAFCYLEKNNVLHRDIRPTNIMIDFNGCVKVIDFGLGKVVEKKDSITNSIGSEVNLNEVTQLPSEYHDGVYTAQTDMYYLGEMLDRLIRRSSAAGEFRYDDVLQVMKSHTPAGRYKSFETLKQAINEWKGMWSNVSKVERNIYRSFTDALMSVFVNRSAESKFQVSDSNMISQLDAVIEENVFEERVHNLPKLAGIFVSGEYHYNPSAVVSVKDVVEFRKWFVDSSAEKKKCVMASLMARLAEMPVKDDSLEIPF